MSDPETQNANNLSLKESVSYGSVASFTLDRLGIIIKGSNPRVQISMLVIRKEQMAAMEASLMARFLNHLRAHLRSEFVEQTAPMTDEELSAMSTSGMQRGRNYGVTTERDLTLFVDLMFLKGNHFDQDPKMSWAKRILLDNTLDGEVKMETIYTRLAALEKRISMSESSPQ